MVVDHFDAPGLSDAWEMGRLNPHAIEMQSQVVRRGTGAVKISLRSRDVFEAGRNGNADSERDELMEARRYVSKQGRLCESSWSMYLPADFPIVPVRLVVAQWKQYCDGEPMPCDDDSPVLAVRYIGGELLITQDIAHQTHVLFQAKRDLRGRWLDLRFRTRFATDSTGTIQAWLSGDNVVDFRGVTANQQNAQTGYASPGAFFFKMGLYRNVMAQPMTIYLDEYTKQLLPPESPL